MNATDRTAIVAIMDEEAVKKLLELLDGQEIRIVRKPRTGLVMMPLTDSFLTDFNLGEVLVTEARVSIDGIEGYGMVSGDDPRRALARAAAEAALAGTDLALQSEILELMQYQHQLRQQMHLREQALTASTRVNFDLMAGA